MALGGGLGWEVMTSFGAWGGEVCRRASQSEKGLRGEQGRATSRGRVCLRESRRAGAYRPDRIGLHS